MCLSRVGDRGPSNNRYDRLDGLWFEREPPILYPSALGQSATARQARRAKAKQSQGTRALDKDQHLKLEKVVQPVSPTDIGQRLRESSS